MGGAHTRRALADLAFASVVPVASPVQTVATPRLNGCTLRPLTSSSRGNLNVVPVEACVNRINAGGLWLAPMALQRNKPPVLEDVQFTQP
jgi:hypothetical protein